MHKPPLPLPKDFSFTAHALTTLKSFKPTSVADAISDVTHVSLTQRKSYEVVDESRFCKFL